MAQPTKHVNTESRNTDVAGWSSISEKANKYVNVVSRNSNVAGRSSIYGVLMSRVN